MPRTEIYNPEALIWTCVEDPNELMTLEDARWRLHASNARMQWSPVRVLIVIYLLSSAAGVYIFWKNMYRLMCLVANMYWSINLCRFVRNVWEAWFILTPEALAEGGSMERVICSPARAIRTMQQPAGLVAWFGRPELCMVVVAGSFTSCPGQIA